MKLTTILNDLEENVIVKDGADDWCPYVLADEMADDTRDYVLCGKSIYRVGDDGFQESVPAFTIHEKG